MEDRARQRFAPDELAIVLSRYDLGAIASIEPFDRGSRKSPKVGIDSAAGRFILKKRAPNRKSPRRVRFAHAIQEHLKKRNFPLARLIPTRTGQQFVEHGDSTYELFEFIPGEPFSGDPAETREAGIILGRFHQALRDLPDTGDAPQGSYHDVVGVRTALNNIGQSISSHESVIGYEFELERVVETLFDEYDQAAEAVNALMRDALPRQIVHGDWHPGNLLFRDGKVAAVLDYDSCRLAETVIDLANGLLHFSLATGGHPSQWPDAPDEPLIRALAGGYAQILPVSETERTCLPHLMIEAVIAESVLPIAQTGQFGRWTGFSFLKMVSRKVAWLRENASLISGWVAVESP